VIKGGTGIKKKNSTEGNNRNRWYWAESTAREGNGQCHID